MKATVSFKAHNGTAEILLFPDTEAEREILRLMAEHKKLTVFNRLRQRGYYSDSDYLSVHLEPSEDHQ